MDELLTQSFYVEWAIMAVSLFNTILPLWLGLTVLLNADHRTPLVWLAGGALLSGGLFFIAHTAILAYGMKDRSAAMDVWWHLGWLPVLVAPISWYAVMLWYAGFWDRPYAELAGGHAQNAKRKTQNEVRDAVHPSSTIVQNPSSVVPHRYLRAHRVLFPAALLLAGVVLGLLVFANPLPTYEQIARFRMSEVPEVFDVPVLAVAYSVYIVACMLLSLDALRHTGPSERVMGDLARRRAKPWLVAVSVVLLLVSLLVAAALFWIMLNVRERALSGAYSGMGFGVAFFDLTIASLLSVAIVLLGQAVVAYEIFTGKTLPRRGFMRQWRSAVILAAGYSVVAAWSMALDVRPLYVLLPATILMTAFYALFSWRSYAERERYMENLRPFVASQRLHENLLAGAPGDAAWGGASVQFRALCEDVLGARTAYLAAVGPLAPLVGPGLAYPSQLNVSAPSLAELTGMLGDAQTMCVPVDPGRYGGAMWAVPLWSGRGLIGVLLLGEKRDGGLYTQEEIEIARASGERLVDTQAGAEMAKRLMSLQRQRLAESQLLDRRARRVLHDDVLPRLHTAMLALSSRVPAGSSAATGQGSRNEAAGSDDQSDALELLAGVHRQISDLLRDMPATSAPDVARLGLIGALRREVEGELGGAFDEVTWEIDPEAAQQAEAIPQLTAEVLFYAAREAVRNAARHGRGSDPRRPLHLRIAVRLRGGLELAIEDDGVGLGASDRQNGGSGQGLALHSTMMAVVGGTLAADSLPGKYTRITLTLPQGAFEG